MALRWYTLAGEVGEPISQYMAGVICYYGMVGSVPDYEQALGWFQKSAKNGNPNVYVCLGRMYFEGKGTVKNYNIALNWLKRASDEGESFSSFIIGQTYSFGGYCVDRDFDLTEIWFMKGANNEDPNSICGMEVLYGIRGDSKRNRDKNFEWCTKAARYNFGIVLNTVTLHFLIVNARKVFVMTT
ncbi:hypothetical protein MFLAVUS_001240 [Mucor flavus]|uniref:Uncharacterized protein n=1 Tax=Mucor flavus TaxID=439312 RepID=A0ABP9YLW5_9FUNG